MLIDILTIFPEMFKPILNESIIKRAQKKALLKAQVHDLRDWATDKHRTTDDRPFGGGPGMVMKPEPIFRAVEELKNRIQNSESRIQNKNKKNQKPEASPAPFRTASGKLRSFETKVILLTPKGTPFTQQTAQKFSQLDHLILICGRYEGTDQRVHDHLADERISIGTYVLTGGELPAMVLTDAVTRLLPGVLGNPESLEHESFSNQNIKKTTNLQPTTRNLKPNLDYPQYTQPRSFTYQRKKLKVPDILLTGNHQEIEKWRKQKVKN